ncbi:MAG TPA: hypothetical protein VF699_09535 [Caulobacteraceae bacterium]
MKQIFALALSAALLGACAMTPPTGQGNQEYAQLKTECDAKGGILVTIPGANSTHDRANYACDIKSGSRLSRQP